MSSISRYSQTPRGVGVGSTEAAVLAAYGRPAARTYRGDEFAGVTRLIYDDIGLSVRLNAITKTAIAVGVFRRGTARKIWRL